MQPIHRLSLVALSKNLLIPLIFTSQGLICEQLSVFRINCVDCLDRTNIVQTAIARNILEIQFRKVGLLPPEVNLPANCRTKYQEIWANNGDALSRQYAGTAALKGDFTRTGAWKQQNMQLSERAPMCVCVCVCVSVFCSVATSLNSTLFPNQEKDVSRV